VAGSQPGQTVTRPYLKKPITKRTGGVAQGVNPEFKPKNHKKKFQILCVLCGRSIQAGHTGVVREVYERLMRGVTKGHGVPGGSWRQRESLFSRCF
jgi:hypothetical protein